MQSKKVILINPPVPDDKIWVREGRCQQWDIWGAPFPPLSLALISTQLKNIGFHTLIIDSGPEKKNIDKVLNDCTHYNPDFAILATASPTLQTDLDWFLRYLKEILPNTQVAAIGIHVSAFPEVVLKQFQLLDYIIIGEPEITSAKLALSVCNGANSIESVKGIAYRNDNGHSHVNKAREFVGNIDSLGFPDWEKVDFRNYLLPIKGRPFSLISFSRGCPYKCKFCATHQYNGEKLRKRSIDSLIREIKYNLNFGVRDFLFWTELMTLDKDHLSGFLNAIFREKLDSRIEWVCNSRVDSSDKEIFSKMKKAGCWQIAFGFEFGDNKILQLAQKGGNCTVEQGRIAAKMAHESGIFVDGHFMMGYPGETEDTLQATIDFACSLPLTFAHFYAVVPFPGAKLYTEALEEKWLASKRYDYLNQDFACMKTDTLDPETINRYIEKAYRKFYYNSKVILRCLRLPKTPQEYINFIKLGLRFYKEMRKQKKL